MLTVYGTGLFLKGLAFGFILAATVGPMWVLCLGFAGWQIAALLR